MAISEAIKREFSEQDTADKLILPYLTSQHHFPTPNSLDYQAQHTLPISQHRFGRYDGIYLYGGYPFAVLEAKKYIHDLANHDFLQARNYALSEIFDVAVPFIILSNGREHQFYKKTTELDLTNGRIEYRRIPETDWRDIVEVDPGKMRILLTPEQLLERVKGIKEAVFTDLKSLFFDFENNKYNLDQCMPHKATLEKIIEERKIYVGTASNLKKQIECSLQTIALHFTMKILFIKIIEDLSSGADTPRIIHKLFPGKEYEIAGGIFGYKIFDPLAQVDKNKLLRLYLKSKRFYTQLGQDIASLNYQDIFRYGFNFHTMRYGKILKARNYDQFFPKEATLKDIRENLIKIDIRNALVYAGAETRINVIGDIYAKLIDKELRDSIGAVYTPDDTVDFMVNLGLKYLRRIRGKKIVENACGSGHFYRLVYRKYVDEVVADYQNRGEEPDYKGAHSEALEHILGRDIDPFAVQLTLLGVFLEQLKDNLMAITLIEEQRARKWKANDFIDCQNSLDPITVDPIFFQDFEETRDIENPKSLLKSCKLALDPDLIIGNPPYGVKVVPGLHYDQVYSLQSKDSYGYFIANAIKRLPEGKRVIFIISSSFLTIKSHFKLRKLILDSAHPGL